MKLSGHYNRNSIYTSLFFLLIGSVIYFFAIDFIAKEQLDQTLEMQLREANEFLRTSGSDPQRFDLDQDHAVFYRIKNEQKVQKRFFDTVYINPVNRAAEPGRAVEDLTKSKDLTYKVVVTISRTGNLALVKIISIVTLILLIALISSIFFTNRFLLAGLWKPFYEMLREIKDLNLEDKRGVAVQKTDVDEFKELNSAIYEMSLRNKKDYLTLKNFTENASHEMMTPLAVITTKLDTLIQGDNLTSYQLELISDVYASVNRSSRLNQSLILLAKIENNLHPENELIDLDTLLLTKIGQVQDLFNEKDLTITQTITKVQIRANKHLIDILLNNLLTNAIWHNIDGGKVHIQLSQSGLIVANTGIQTALKTDFIFQRFHKGKTSPGMGLGLTLAKNICEHYQYSLCYDFIGENHMFSVKLT